MSIERPAFLGGLRTRTSESTDLEDVQPRKSTLKKRWTRSTRNRARKKIPSLDLGVVTSQFGEPFDIALEGDYSSLSTYLNKFYEIIQETLPEQLNDPDFFELLCRKMLMVLRSEYEGVRAIAFRILRKCTFQQRNLVYMLTSHVDIYAVRALDLRADNVMEREAAFQLLSQMMTVYKESTNLKQLVAEARNNPTTKTQYAFPKSIMQPVIAIALRELHRKPDAKVIDVDPLALPCVAFFLELAVDERDLVLEMAGTDWIVCSLIGTSGVSSGVATLVSRVLVAWLDDHHMRQKANLHLLLEQIFAPLIEYGFFQTSNIENRDFKPMELPLEKYSRAFLAVLRSWPGLLSCAAVGPNSSVIASSPLKLLEYLGLGTVVNANLLRIRDMIVDICAEFVDKPYANEKFACWKDALNFYRKMNYPDSFRCSLKDDFVLAQGHLLNFSRPEWSNHMDLVTSFRAMAAFILINAGLQQSLSRLIIAHPDDSASLKATLLLSDLCRLASTFMPTEWRGAVLSLPTLVQSACETISQNDGSLAVNGLYSGEVQETTYLNAGNAQLVLYRMEELTRAYVEETSEGLPIDCNYALFTTSDKVTNSRITYACDSQSIASVLHDAIGSTEPVWASALGALSAVVRDQREGREHSRGNISDKIFHLVEKIMIYLSPSARRLRASDSLVALVGKRAVQCALALIDDEHYEHLLLQFADECYEQMTPEKFKTGTFCVKNLTQSGSMYYFSLLGEMSTTLEGIAILEKTGIMQMFHELMSKETPSEYVKLIVSCLDYSIEQSMAKMILKRALTSSNEAARKWCTRFLAILAPLRGLNFGDWGIRLLIGQLGDSSVKVVRHAIRQIHTWMPHFPKSVLLLRTVPLDSFGDAGILLRAHIYGVERVCNLDKNGAQTSLETWMRWFNVRYVETMEEEMRQAMLSVRRTVGGQFARPCQDRFERFGVRAHVHLLGELAKHDFGRNLLVQNGVVDALLDGLRCNIPHENKAAVVALAHIGKGSIVLLPSETVPRMVRLAEECPTLSVRGTAYWALCILGASEDGARALARLGWESSRHRTVVNEVREEMEGNRPITRSRVHTANLVPDIPYSIDRGRGCSVESPSICLSPVPRTRANSLNLVPDRPKEKRRSSAPSVYPDLDDQMMCLSPFEASSARIERTLTVESAINSVLTSGFGSLVDEGRRRTTSVAEEECRSRNRTIEEVFRRLGRSRSSTLQTGFSGTSTNVRLLAGVDENKLDYTHEDHFASRNRQRFRLCKLRTKKYVQIYRNVGDPVRYQYMTHDELISVAEYKRMCLDDDWLYEELKRRSDVVEKNGSHPLPYISLPCEVYTMCRNIFPKSRQDQSLFFITNKGVDDRGAKSGYGRHRTDHMKPHQTHRCFHCEHRKHGADHPPGAPADADLASLRTEVLQLIDLLEIKHTMPEKHLLRLRAQHPWLFSWPCLYADVLELLDQYRFKDSSRTFLQEIFWDAMKL